MHAGFMPTRATQRIRQRPSTPKHSPWVVAANSPIHGRGVYARTTIPEGTRIIEYAGERISSAEAERRETLRLARQRRGGDASVYVFFVSPRRAIDGRHRRNVARWINHACAPNCRSEISRGRIWIVAQRDIPAGAELTFDYGFNFREGLQHPCRCGAPNCAGYIISAEQRWRLRKRRAARAG
ncbi:MAG TPA: SET domain-containing protein-lysine N-methyltransferase [Opitutaceae bacterium]